VETANGIWADTKPEIQEFLNDIRYCDFCFIRTQRIENVKIVYFFILNVLNI